MGVGQGHRMVYLCPLTDARLRPAPGRGERIIPGAAGLHKHQSGCSCSSSIIKEEIERGSSESAAASPSDI